MKSIQSSQYVAAKGSKTGILLSGFPRISETFILNELLQLQYEGFPFMIFALKPGEKNVHLDVERLQKPVVYVPHKITLTVIVLALWSAFCIGLPCLHQFFLVLSEIWRGGKKEKEFNRLQSTVRWLWLCYQLRQNEITQIHAHFAHDPASMAFWAHQLLGIPYSFTGHAKDIYCYSETQLKEKIHAARFVVTCTGHNRENLQRVSQNGTPIHCLYHGIDFEKFKPVGRKKTEPVLILAVGRLMEKKGFYYLIEACKILKAEGFPFQCQIVGDGPLRDHLAAHIENAGLSKLVTLPGKLTHQRLIPLYYRASLFVSPNILLANGDRDGIPNVIIEAMAMELPVVSTRISGIPEAVRHDITGLLVEERNTEALAAAMLAILINPWRAGQMGRAARVHAKKMFSLQNNVHKLKELLVA